LQYNGYVFFDKATALRFNVGERAIGTYMRLLRKDGVEGLQPFRPKIAQGIEKAEDKAHKYS
jgi:hypothetical protein